MARFFRNTRKTLLGQNKIGKYFKYAIGEIFLVVIGILIAVQINNWNENRKTKAQLKTIFKTIKEDLKTDTLMSAKVIRYYDTINKYSNKIISNNYNFKNIDSCFICRNLLTNFNPISIQKKGFNLLQNYSELNTNESDSLVISLSQFYSFFDPMLSNNNEMIKSEALTNLNFIKKQKWFIPWTQGKVTDEMRLYFGESQDYKNRVAGNNIIATSNHQKFVKLYKDGATKLLKVIEKRLEDN